jgi:hypothetical protein
MSILLDFHRVNSNYQSANPFNDLTMTEYTDCWNKVLDRYFDYEKVKWVGLFNEFQGADDQGKYWSEMMRQTISLLETRQYHGRWIYLVGGTQWGGSLHDIDMEGQPYSDRVRLEIHKYHFSGTSTEEDWNHSFGNYPEKIIVGEWAINRENWDERFISYLQRRNIHDNFYWTMANSGDTINIWENDCESLNWDVINKIKLLWGERRNLRGTVLLNATAV